MSRQPNVSLHMMPVELFYRILSCLNTSDIFMSLSGVCRTLDQLIAAYGPYQVDFT